MAARLNGVASRDLILITSSLLVLILFYFAWFIIFEPTNQDLLEQARKELKNGRHEVAEKLSMKAVKRDRSLFEAWRISALAAARQKQFEIALERYAEIPDDGSEVAIFARIHAGNICWQETWDLSRAETEFLAAWSQSSEPKAAVEQLARLYGFLTLFSQQEKFLIGLIQQGQFNNLHLHLLGAGYDVPIDRTRFTEVEQGAAEDPLLILSLAGLAIIDHRLDEARQLLEQLLQTSPNLIAAHEKLGQVLSVQQDRNGLRKWRQSLPSNVQKNAEIWAVLGVEAELGNRTENAIRCYWESLCIDPNLTRSCYRLGLLLANHDEEQSDLFLTRTKLLQEFATHVDSSRNGTDVVAIKETIALAEQLGFIWEAYGWSVMATRLRPSPDWAKATLHRLEQRIGQLPLLRCSPEDNPALQIDLSSFPVPTQIPSGQLTGVNADLTIPESTTQPAGIRFKDSANDVNIHFQYENGGDPLATGLRRMYEFTGGGVAVLDYDRDGWPDIYLTQGTQAPGQTSNHEFLDQLYRNGGTDQRFIESTAESLIHETGFGQGVAVGDFNSDGFPDLFIANFGSNRFLQNEGDGTFSDVTSETGMSHEKDWSTSCVFADLNGNGLTDLYVVNYLSGEDILTRVCADKRKIFRHTCPPSEFRMANDRVYLNAGNGRFTEQSVSSQVIGNNGRGLGVVTVPSVNSFKPNIFIANDGMANSFLVNQTRTHSNLKFSEAATPLGLAFNSEGKAEACMGVATGDVDRDGNLDVFVTNFEGESNTLYLQRTPGTFEDQTSNYQLAEPSEQMLGFGTQFLDADLDGWLDLLVANGHVNDFRDQGSLFQMPPQFFRNLNGKSFSEVSQETICEYFKFNYLGRSVALIDWNRDGKQDAIITHLDAPAAILTNLTQTQNHFLSIQFSGTISERDATGVEVRLEYGDLRDVYRLLSGSGYQASNQRQILIGTGRVSRIDRLEVRWPSGRIQVFKNVDCNQEYLVRESDQQLWEILGTSSVKPLEANAENKSAHN